MKSIKKRILWWICQRSSKQRLIICNLKLMLFKEKQAVLKRKFVKMRKDLSFRINSWRRPKLNTTSTMGSIRTSRRNLQILKEHMAIAKMNLLKQNKNCDSSRRDSIIWIIHNKSQDNKTKCWKSSWVLKNEESSQGSMDGSEIKEVSTPNTILPYRQPAASLSSSWWIVWRTQKIVSSTLGSTTLAERHSLLLTKCKSRGHQGKSHSNAQLKLRDCSIWSLQKTKSSWMLSILLSKTP